MKKLKISGVKIVCFSIFVGIFGYGFFYLLDKNTNSTYFAPRTPHHAVVIDYFYQFQKQKNNNTNKFNLIYNVDQLYGKSSDSKTLLDIILYFSKNYQMRCVANAINQIGSESVFLSTTSNQISVLNTDTSNKILKISPISSNYKNNKINTYNALVSVGCQMELTNPVITINHSVNFKEKLQDLFLTQDLSKILDFENILTQFGTELRDRITQILQPSLQRYKLTEVRFTNYLEVEHQETHSGISMVAETGRNVLTNRSRLETLFEQCEAQQQYAFYQTLIDSLQIMRHELIDLSQGTINIFQFRETVQQILVNLDIVNFDNDPIMINQLITTREIKTKISPLNLQLYSKDFFGLNGSFGYNLQNKNVSIGVGKAYFLRWKNSNFGFVSAVDISTNFSPKNSNILSYGYNGLNGKAFIGVGYRL